MEQYTNMARDSSQSVLTDRFYGLNRTRKPNQGEMESMQNMSSGEFPCASPALSRSAVVSVSNDIQAVAAPDSSASSGVTGLTGIMNGAFYYNGVKKSGTNLLPSDYTWLMERLGNIYIIAGYKGTSKAVYSYNATTNKFDDYLPSMDKLIVTAGIDDNRGNYLETFRYDYQEVRDHTATLVDGTTMTGADFFDKYNSQSKTENIFAKVFSEGDDLEISGFPAQGAVGGMSWWFNVNTGVHEYIQAGTELNNTVDLSAELNIEDVSKNAIVSAIVTGFEVKPYQMDGGAVCYRHRIYFNLLDKEGDNIEFIDLAGLTNAVYVMGIKLTRKIPAFTDITTHDNRLWLTSPSGMSIYASSSDEIYDFSGESITEGLAARLNTLIPGKFTGICSYQSYVVAFKESHILIIYGSNAATYRLEAISGIGCIDPKSIAVTPNGVIFLSYKGFYIYSGSTPRLISDKLNMQYAAAAAGFDGNIYYVSALRADGVRELLAYDMRYGTWHIRDDFEALGMFRFKGRFYFADKRNIYTESASPDEWSFTLARTTDNTLDHKTVNEVWIYADVSEDADFTVYTDVSDSGWRQHTTFNDTGLKLFRCPIRALSGTNYRIRIDGHGKIVFYEIEVKESDQKGRRYKER